MQQQGRLHGHAIGPLVMNSLPESGVVPCASAPIHTRRKEREREALVGSYFGTSLPLEAIDEIQQAANEQ